VTARVRNVASDPVARSAEQRAGAYDWSALAGELDRQGCAVLEGLLSPQECGDIAALYPQEEHFRSRVVMARHGFGRGEYRYFKYPLPGLIDGLRTALYPHLAPIANDWNERMRVDARYPAGHADFLRLCHDVGQLRPTPLLLQYGPATTTACTRTCTGRWPSRCRSPCCCPSPTASSPAASSC
jgi:hypothetical protein